MKKERKQEIIDAINETVEQWDTADWTHVFVAIDDDKQENIDPYSCDPIYCEGNNAECQVCADAAGDALTADSLGRDAIAYLYENDIARARKCIGHAAEIEGEHGDCPFWGRVKLLFDDLLKEEEKEEENTN